MASGPKRKDLTDRAHRVTEVTRKLRPKGGGYGFGFVTDWGVLLRLRFGYIGNLMEPALLRLRKCYGPGFGQAGSVTKNRNLCCWCGVVVW